MGIETREAMRAYRRDAARPLAFATMLALFASASASAAEDETGAKSTMEIYGFAMLDMGYQTKQNDPNWFDVQRPTKLPAFEDQFGEDGNFFAGVRQSRLGVKTSTPTSLGDIKTTPHFESQPEAPVIATAVPVAR